MDGGKIRQYRVIERLGAGGMGHVYRAIDETLGRDVALKILDSTSEQSAARLRAEATALARLSHPGIATVHELIEDDGRLVMVMELVRGQTLQHLLEQAGVFTPRRAADLCMQTLSVLEHAHTAGIVHRDLKPGNLMITDSGSIKILDFGIARLNDSVNLTNAGTMLGTPAYMAPEQVLGLPIDARADLYAMGVVLFRFVTADLPFRGETPFEMAQSQVNDVPMKASALRAELPPWVDDILTHAMAKKPGDRFQSAAEFHEALARATAVSAPHAAVPAAVEVTEVLPRPDFSKMAPAATAAPAQKQKPRPRQLQLAPRSAWLGAAAVVLAIGIWAFKPSHASAPEPVLTPPPVATEPAPPEPTPAAADEPVVAKVATNAAPVRSAATPTPTSKPSPAKSAPTTPGRPLASFNDVKSLAVSGSRSWTSDVVVQFSDTGVSVQPAGGNTAPEVLSYQSIAKATYVQSKDPKLDPALSRPAEKIDVPGIGILSKSRHWLVFQGTDHYLILRLDGDDRLDVMKAFEERAGIVIERK